MKLGVQVGLDPGHIVLDAYQTHPQKGHSPQFSAHVRYGQTVGRIIMPLGVEAGLGPGDIVLNGDPVPPPQRGTAANFRPMSIMAKRLDASG